MFHTILAKYPGRRPFCKHQHQGQHYPRLSPSQVQSLVRDWVLVCPQEDFQDGGECCSSVQPAFSRQIICWSSARGFLRKVIYPFNFAAHSSVQKWYISRNAWEGYVITTDQQGIQAQEGPGLIVTVFLTKILILAEALCFIPRLVFLFSCIIRSFFYRQYVAEGKVFSSTMFLFATKM